MSTLHPIIPQLFLEKGPYHTETSPLICFASQSTGFYMIMTSVINELKKSSSVRNERFPMRKVKEFVNLYTFKSIPQSIPAFHNAKYYMMLLIIPLKINPLAIYCPAPVSYCKENNFLTQKEKTFQVPKFQKKKMQLREISYLVFREMQPIILYVKKLDDSK